MPFTVHIDANRGWGGGQAQSLGLALALAERGENTYFITQRDSALSARLQSTNLPWESLHMRGLRAVTAGSWLRLGRRLRQLRPDILHAHDAAAEAPAIFAARGLSKPRPRVVVTRRTARAPHRPLLWCDRVICVSQAVRQRCLAAGIAAERLAVVPDFVDCQRLDPGAAPARDDPRPTILAVGRLTSEKGHAVLLSAMPRVLQGLPEARLVICGQGPEQRSLSNRAEAEGIASRVEFAGFVPDVRQRLAQADVLVMPSLSEGLGVAVLEAMAMGKPVVASNTGGLPEAVADGETGLLVPPGNAEALAGALLALLEDPDRAQAMGKAGRRRAVDHFDRRVIVDRMLSLYREVLSGV
jgi:glycosyltransferase involved in cell wall biosynthesis